MNPNQSKQSIQLLTYHYYGVIVALAALFMLIIFRLIPFETTPDAVSAVMERYTIVFTIIAIPLALKLFAYLTKKRPLDSEEKALSVYKKAFYLRLYILCVVVAMNEAFFAVSRNMNFFWLTIILFIVFVFCKPSFNEFSMLVVNKPQTDK